MHGGFDTTGPDDVSSGNVLRSLRILTGLNGQAGVLVLETLPGQCVDVMPRSRHALRTVAGRACSVSADYPVLRHYRLRYGAAGGTTGGRGGTPTGGTGGASTGGGLAPAPVTASVVSLAGSEPGGRLRTSRS